MYSLACRSIMSEKPTKPCIPQMKYDPKSNSDHANPPPKLLQLYTYECFVLYICSKIILVSYYNPSNFRQTNNCLHNWVTFRSSERLFK